MTVRISKASDPVTYTTRQGVCPKCLTDIECDLSDLGIIKQNEQTITVSTEYVQCLVSTCGHDVRMMFMYVEDYLGDTSS